MDRHEFKQKWNEIKKHIRDKWNWMTESDIDQIHGDYDKWSRMMEKKGYSKTEAEWEFKNWNWEAKGWQKEQQWHQQGENKKESSWGREVQQDPWGKQSQKSEPQQNQNPKKKGKHGGWEDEGKKRKAG